MKEELFLSQTQRRSTTLKRWAIVIVSLGIQIGIILFCIFTNQQQPNQPDIMLAPVPGNNTVCRVISVAPFSPAWVNELRPGSLVYPTAETLRSGQIHNCQISGDSMISTAPGAAPISIHAGPQGHSPLDALQPELLALIFDVVGIAIFFRSQDRPTARITYALFYCVALICHFFGIVHLDPQSNDIFLTDMQIIISGLATTFVCLFPHALNQHPARKKKTWLPYHALNVGIVLVAFSLPFLFVRTPPNTILPGITFFYTIACVLIVIGILVWGVSDMARNDQQLARMIMISVIFLLLISILSLRIIPPTPFFNGGLLHLIPVPLMILPIICYYTIFRHQLIGTASLLSRKAMRVFLWALLACVFIFPGVILLRNLNSITNEPAWRDYVYAGLMVLSLGLFPFVWSKVRDAGDHVFYHDFYQYNDELRQLSTDLTGLRGLDQISAFILPRLEQLLNANEVSLFIRATSQDELRYTSEQNKDTHLWHIYRYSMKHPIYTDEHLRYIADRALQHFQQRSFEPRVLDNVLLLSLYDGEMITGFLALGPKQNDEVYSRQDKSFLASLVAQLSVLEVNNRYLTQAQADAQKLTALNHRVISAQEEERRHLALDLHDDVLQEAMLLVRQLSDSAPLTNVTGTLTLARSMVTNLRRTCLALRPSLLEDLGLAEALRWLARQTEQMGGGNLRVIAYCIGTKEAQRVYATESVDLSLYRVAQEALTNVLKHARATRVVIRLQYSPAGHISLIIADNGCGFRMGDPRHESLGIVGMHERMGSIRGKISVRTSPGHGTAVRAYYQSTYKPILRMKEMMR